MKKSTYEAVKFKLHVEDGSFLGQRKVILFGGVDLAAVIEFQGEASKICLIFKIVDQEKPKCLLP